MKDQDMEEGHEERIPKTRLEKVANQAGESSSPAMRYPTLLEPMTTMKPMLLTSAWSVEMLKRAKKKKLIDQL